MSDNQGTSALAGEPAAATATQPTTAVPGSVTQRIDPTEQPASNSPDWIKDWAPEDQGIVEKKAWKSPQDLYKSYRELEKTLGQDKIVLPKDGADPKEWDPVYSKLGRPDTADSYKVPEGADEKVFKALAPDLHAAGLNQTQIEKITKGYNKLGEQMQAEVSKAWIADIQTADSTLEKEWGSDTHQQVELSRRALGTFGMSVPEFEERIKGASPGTAEKMFRILNAAGRFIAEDNSANIASDSTAGFGLTGNRAAAELGELRANKEFMARVWAKDPIAKAKYDRLNAAAADAGLVRTTVKTNFKKTVTP